MVVFYMSTVECGERRLKNHFRNFGKISLKSDYRPSLGNTCSQYKYHQYQGCRSKGYSVISIIRPPAQCLLHGWVKPTQRLVDNRLR